MTRDPAAPQPEPVASRPAAGHSGRLDGPRTEASPYDLWLDRRLADRHDPTWLATQSLYAATTVCRLLGAELLRIESHRGNGKDDGCNGGDHQNRSRGCGGGDSVGGGSEDAQWRLRAAQATGFDVLRRGEDVLRTALDQLAATATAAKAEPRKAFGRLFLKLSTDHRGDPAFDAVRGVLRDCILASWSIAAGQEVLGETLPARRLHSICSAALATGVSPGLLARLLIEAGVLPPEANRSDIRRTFDAQAHAGLLAEIPALVGATAMTEAMGATLGELASLEVDGVLQP